MKTFLPLPLLLLTAVCFGQSKPKRVQFKRQAIYFKVVDTVIQSDAGIYIVVKGKNRKCRRYHYKNVDLHIGEVRGVFIQK